MKKAIGCFTSVLVVLIALVVLVVVVAVTQGDQAPTEPVSVVFDALQDEVKDGHNITEDELIEKLGEPDSVEEWDYETASGTRYPVKTLYYENAEYSFNNDTLQRVTLWDKISYSNKSDFLGMFNLKKYSNTEVNDTGSYYRAYNCGVHDIWIGYEDGEITMVKISYGDMFEQP